MMNMILSLYHFRMRQQIHDAGMIDQCSSPLVTSFRSSISAALFVIPRTPEQIK